MSGGGTGILKADNANRATITGSFTVGDHVGEICLIGTMSPGNSSLNTLATAGDQVGHINVTAGLTLLGAITGSSPAASTTRLTLQANAPTTTLTSLGWLTSGMSIQDFVTSLPGGTSDQQGALNGTFGNLSGHDYVNIGGAFTINPLGIIKVTSTYSFSGGELFNLLDWVTAVGFGSTYGTDFVTGTRFQTGNELLTAQDFDLPTLGAGFQWDTSLFASHGVVIVVPEPGRALLIMLGILLLGMRRRRAL